MKKKLNWRTLVVMILFHMGAIIALFFFTKHRLGIALFIWFFGLCPGIGVGFHRLLTHRGFKTHKWIEYLLTLFGYLALQGGAVWWVAIHRKHHMYTDQPNLDPHTPRDGIWWAHLDWMIHREPDLNNTALMQKYAPDLLQDKFHVFMNRVIWLPVTVVGLGILYLTDFATMCWGIFLPVTISWHSSWLVNSATHLWGSRTFDTKDDSTNSWWVACLTFGEGWHNNHHHAPVRARHGVLWFQIDFNWYVIVLLRTCGLAWHVKA